MVAIKPTNLNRTTPLWTIYIYMSLIYVCSVPLEYYQYILHKSSFYGNQRNKFISQESTTL